MKVAISLGIHSSISSLIEKTQGDLDRVSEFLLINEYSKKFEEVFLFSSDTDSFQDYLPKNCKHIFLGGRFRYLILGWLTILNFIIKKKIKIIFVEGTTALPSIFLLNKITNVKTVLNYNYLWHTTYAFEKRKMLKKRIRKNIFFAYFFKIFEKTSLKFIDFVLAASTEIKIFVNDRKKVLDIKKGIALDDFNPKIVKKHKIFNKINGYSILFAARLVPLKNPLTLIEAYKIAKKKIPNLNLIICGDGELMEDCKKNADEKVFIMGFQKDIPGLLKGANIFVLVPTYEASPRSLMEAMSMGVPCITTKVGGIPDYIDEKSGVFVEPGNPFMLADKIEFLLKNKEISKNISLNARKRIVENHDLKKNLTRTIEFITRYIEKGNI